MRKKTLLGIFVCLFFSVVSHAQIGYQVALLNSATGEPRANETLSAGVTISDVKGSTVYSGTQSVTSNDFGILSLTVGNEDTFKDVAIGRLPMSISVTVDGVLIGKSQILNVPVAEVANTLKSDFTLEELCGKTHVQTWVSDGHTYKLSFTFNSDNTFSFTSGYIYKDYLSEDLFLGTYEIEGNNIYAYPTTRISGVPVETHHIEGSFFLFRWKDGVLYMNDY